MPDSLGPIRIGISSCLLGQKVRFDGGHKRDTFLTETLGRYVEWVPVCPEVEVGMRYAAGNRATRPRIGSHAERG